VCLSLIQRNHDLFDQLELFDKLNQGDFFNDVTIDNCHGFDLDNFGTLEV